MRLFYLILLALPTVLSSCNTQHICPAYRTGGTGSWTPSGGSYAPLLARELVKPRIVLKNDSLLAAQKIQDQVDTTQNSNFDISQDFSTTMLDSNLHYLPVNSTTPPAQDLVMNTTTSVITSSGTPGGSLWGYSSGSSSLSGGVSGDGGIRKKRNEWAIDLIKERKVTIYGRDSLPIINQTIEIKNNTGKVIWITTTDSSGIAKLASGFIGDCSKPPSNPNDPEDSVMLHVLSIKHYLDSLFADTLFIDTVFYDTVFSTTQLIGSIDTTFIHYEEIANGEMYQTHYLDSVFIQFDSLTGTETQHSIRTETTDTINADNEEIITDIKYFSDSSHSSFFIESNIDVYNVLITNSSGGVYKQLNLTEKQTVDLGMKNLPVGVYFLQFKTLTGRKIRGKMLKEKYQGLSS
ncbi:MAG: hypothetical protein ACI9J3_001007 [Parvicellaceae bacterium]|jgi:hypothetical protein